MWTESAPDPFNYYIPTPDILSPVFGGIVINGPSTLNYDEDLGVLFLNDWSHTPVDTLYTIEQTGASFKLDNGLINGTNIYTVGRLAIVLIYPLFSIDNHTLKVIGNDLVPIHPYTTDVLDIAMGQRYDVIVRADQNSTSGSSFWMRAIPQET
ncbi:multicopper oxidase protein [Rutstroemia sp. NJR-2017a WRK4]|nr:multicopper oxidase protein [Rutstroemia sp. NJR-2017a WRK4]